MRFNPETPEGTIAAAMMKNADPHWTEVRVSHRLLKNSTEFAVYMDWSDDYVFVKDGKDVSGELRFDWEINHEAESKMMDTDYVRQLMMKMINSDLESGYIFGFESVTKREV